MYVGNTKRDMRSRTDVRTLIVTRSLGARGTGNGMKIPSTFTFNAGGAHYLMPKRKIGIVRDSSTARRCTSNI
jgi:hypothetical protein